MLCYCYAAAALSVVASTSTLPPLLYGQRSQFALFAVQISAFAGAICRARPHRGEARPAISQLRQSLVAPASSARSCSGRSS